MKFLYAPPGRYGHFNRSVGTHDIIGFAGQDFPAMEISSLHKSLIKSTLLVQAQEYKYMIYCQKYVFTYLFHRCYFCNIVTIAIILQYYILIRKQRLKLLPFAVNFTL